MLVPDCYHDHYHMQDYPIPTPRTLYIYNDLVYYRLPPQARRAFLQRLDDLERALQANPHVVMLDIGEQLGLLAATSDPSRFAETLAVGEAGYRIAAGLHARTGWFPKIRLISVAREEIAPDRYRVQTTSDQALDEQLGHLDPGPLALVDDTIYSGLTVSSIVACLSQRDRARLHIFCLQGIAASIAAIRRICPVTAGLEIHGDPGVGVSVIKASHLFIRGAVRPAQQPALAFFERQLWMEAWFPRNARLVIALCEDLCLLAEEERLS